MCGSLRLSGKRPSPEALVLSPVYGKPQRFRKSSGRAGKAWPDSLTGNETLAYYALVTWATRCSPGSTNWRFRVSGLCRKRMTRTLLALRLRVTTTRDYQELNPADG